MLDPLVEVIGKRRLLGICEVEKDLPVPFRPREPRVYDAAHARSPGQRRLGDLARVFAGDYRTIEQPTLEAQLDGQTLVAVNDVVATSSTLGRMIELGWSVAGEDLGVVSCDGMICSTPSGSTAYNLSNGGPVLVRGLDAMAITFIAPHSLHARPLVVPRGAELTVRNATPDVDAAVLADGRESGELVPGRTLSIRLGEQRSLLATLPETTFFGRYRETFTS